MQVKMHRAVKYRMYPNKAQAQLIDRTIGCARFIYNQMLETRITTYQGHRRDMQSNASPIQRQVPVPMRGRQSRTVRRADALVYGVPEFLPYPRSRGLP